MINNEMHIDTFYTCLKSVERKFDKYGRKNRLRAETQEEYVLWKEEVREILKELIGFDKMEKCEGMGRVVEKVQLEDGIIREKVILRVEEDVWMPMYILIPARREGEKLKCFITPPGHQGAGKYSVAGRDDIECVKKQIEFYNYDYGMQLAKMGYVAICPDCRGFGERRELALQGEDEGAFLNSTCFHLAHMAEPLGMTVIGMCTWDLCRLIDYIEERNEWDTENIGCLGFSGGGMQALWLAALDERVKTVIISGYMYGYKDSLLKLNGNCSCNYVPHLYEHVDMGDIGALIAPRKLMIQSCKEDHLNGERGLVNALEQVEIIRSAYKLFDADESIYHDICEGGHRWHDENLGMFLKNNVGV